MENKEEETIQERQENEFVMLQSMYPGDIRDMRPESWKTFQPLEFIITILPREIDDATKDAHVQVDLHLKCSFTYPEIIPDISIHQIKGISSLEGARLVDDLKKLANTLCGEVMMHELIQHVRDFISQRNIPRHGSFYDEMLYNQRQVEENKLEEKKKREALIKQKEALRRKAIEEEIQRKQSALREESKLKKSPSFSICGSPPGMSGDIPPLKVLQPISRRRLSSTTEASIPSDCGDHTGTEMVEFSTGINRNIQKGKCLGHKYKDNVVLYAGMDLESGLYVTITEWIFKGSSGGAKAKPSHFKPSPPKEVEYVLKLLSPIEQELSSLCKLRHANLVHYLGIKTSSDKSKVVCLVLQEFVSGSNLAFHLTKKMPVDYPLLQHYMQGILEALSFLHKNSVIHRDLKDTCVFVDNRGDIRVAGYSLDKRLLDLYCLVTKENMEQKFPFSIGRGGKKSDIFRLGILCLSLAQGEVVNSANPDIPSTFPLPLRDFLEKSLARLEQDRWSADQLLEHGFLKPAAIPKEPDFRSEVDPLDYENVEGITKEAEISADLLRMIPRHSGIGQSRLHDEFEICGFLGKGGFGSVFKARNKLDCGMYAIKCIQLNPNNKQLNRKMKREVKLLSRLNHENVIRYYNSWLETSCQENSSVDGSSISEELTSAIEQRKKDSSLTSELSKSVLNSLRSPAEVEFSSAFSVSFSCENKSESDISSSEDEEEEEDMFGTSVRSQHYSPDASNSIVFEEITTNTDCASKFKEYKQVSEEESSMQKMKHVMYIQMEFCDKNTLHDEISNDLYKNEARVWQLFREIVEGLVHIHEQGMIHRDLKPVNIFMDAHNHLKIGDFGLATNIVHDPQLPQQTDKISPESKLRSGGTDSDSRTGVVGTALYIAPEVQTEAQHALYNQKIDIYSLGIIFFEMCYAPLNTSMERSLVLTNLRRPEIILPDDFDSNEKSSQAFILRWLLNHDPNQRPTSQELLLSKHLPPPQMEEAELQDMLRHTISNPQSKAYKHMISSLLDQEVSAAADVTYDIDMHKGSFSNRVALAQKFVNDTAVKVFERHGAVSVNTSFLMPKSNLYEGNEFCVKLVDHGGGVVSLPYDLRVPFARFVVKNKITFLKRFHIAPVYRENKVYGLHPRTLYECAFDIVTPDPGSLIADAEVLVVIKELFAEFPDLQNRRHFIRLNHTLILKGILMYCGINEDAHDEAFPIIADAKIENSNKDQVVPYLMSSLNISEQTAVTLYRFLSLEGLSFKQISHQIKYNFKEGEPMKLIMQGIRELETLTSNAKALGFNITFSVAHNLIHKNMHHFSGPIFQFVCLLKKKTKKERLDILAAGGRYDQLIQKTRSTTGSHDVNQSAVGVSIAIERLVYALLECDEFQPTGSFDVLVCALGRKTFTEEKSAIVRDLWNAGISTHMLYEPLQSLEEIQELCVDFRASHMIVLKDSETKVCRVRWLDKDKYVERKVPSSEVVDFIAQKISVLKPKSEAQDSGNDNTSAASQCSITFITNNEKIPPNAKRRYEAQISFHLSSILECLSSKFHIDIIAVELTSQVIKALTAYLKVDGNEIDFQASISKVTELHQRHRKYINSICDEICKAKFEKRQPMLILYGLTDNSYSLMT